MRYFPALDGLRAIAVLSAMAFHFFPRSMPGGFTGVDVFFVLSGFLLTGRWNEARAAGTASPWDFYVRRWKRIYPALLVCLFVTSVAFVLLTPLSELSRPVRYNGFAAIFGLGNLTPLHFELAYFALRSEYNPFLHTWSLGVEEQFYVLFPLFLALGVRARFALVAASLFACAIVTRYFPTAAFHLMPTRFWELGAGCLAWDLVVPARRARACAVAGFLLLAAGLTPVVVGRVPFPGALLPVAGAVLLVLAARAGGTPRWLEAPVLVALGKRAYSLYLWHWPVLVLLRWTLGIETPEAMAAAIAASLVFAELGYRTVELPGRRLRLPARPRRTALALATVLGSVAVVVAAVLFAQTKLSMSRVAGRDWYPTARTPARKPAADGLLSGRRLFVVGDSHAKHYVPMFERFSDDDGVEVHEHDRGHCGVMTIVRQPGPECDAYFREAWDDVERNARPGDVLFLPANRTVRFVELWLNYSDAEVAEQLAAIRTPERRAYVLAQAKTVFERAERLGLRVVLDSPKPVFAGNAFLCADWFDRNHYQCRHGLTISRADLRRHVEGTMEVLAAVAREHPSLVVWDTLDVLCPGDVCRAFDGDRPIFYDGDHLARHGNDLLYPAFRAFFRDLFATRPPTQQASAP